VTPRNATEHDARRSVMDDVLLRPATVVADMVRKKEISARDLTEMLLARIDSINPAVNAVVELRREDALAEADAADRAIAQGDDIGPLHGVPMTIKESFRVTGMHSTWGNPAFMDFVADRDAAVVRCLKRAGAIIVGTTNVSFMLADFAQTANEVYGVTNNPWDLARTPGGSTGGGAAAVAAGLSFLEYGSDLVGSIRIPSAFCGVYGLRPSVGIVPLTGFQVPGTPSAPTAMTYMSAIGPLARSAGDLRTALRVTAGPEPPAGNAYSWTLAPPRHARLDDFRVGVVLDHERAPVSSDVAEPLAEAVDVVRRAGATVVEGWPEGIDPDREAESFGFHIRLFFAFQQPGEDGPTMREFIEHEHRRMDARTAWSRYFEEVDVLLCPVNFTAAFPHDSRPLEERMISTPEGERPYVDQPFWISHPSLGGLPSVVAPVGRTNGGLPVGVQIVGPLFEDDTPLTFAERLGEVIKGYEAPTLLYDPRRGVR
jgi:amidase